MEAAQSQRPAEYRTEDGRGLYRAEPQGYNAATRCKRVHERVWQDGSSSGTRSGRSAPARRTAGVLRISLQFERRTMSRIVSAAAAVLVALCIGECGGVLAASAPEPIAVEKPSTVEKIDEAHAEQEDYFGKLFERVDRLFGEQYVQDRDRKIQVRAGEKTTFNEDGKSTDTTMIFALRVPLRPWNAGSTSSSRLARTSASSEPPRHRNSTNHARDSR